MQKQIFSNEWFESPRRNLWKIKDIALPLKRAKNDFERSNRYQRSDTWSWFIIMKMKKMRTVKCDSTDMYLCFALFSNVKLLLERVVFYTDKHFLYLGQIKAGQNWQWINDILIVQWLSSYWRYSKLLLPKFFCVDILSL